MVVFRQLGLVILAFSIVFLGPIMCYGLMMNIDGSSERIGRESAGPLIVVLEEYRQGWGEHPKELDDLVPDFVESIPKPGWRFHYYYESCSVDEPSAKNIGYTLSFPLGNSDYFCQFSSVTEEWECQDSTPPYQPICMSDVN